MFITPAPAVRMGVKLPANKVSVVKMSVSTFKYTKIDPCETKV